MAPSLRLLSAGRSAVCPQGPAGNWAVRRPGGARAEGWYSLCRARPHILYLPHMQNYYLLPQGNDWKLTTDRGTRIFGGITDKQKALARAVSIVTAESGILKIHRRDGSIEEVRNLSEIPLLAAA